MPTLSLSSALQRATRRTPSSSPTASARQSVEVLHGKDGSPGSRPRGSIDRDHRRISLLSLGGGRPPSTSSLPPQAGHLKIQIESPPLMLYGNPSESTGALMSGQLQLHITSSDPIGANVLQMRLIAQSDFTKPVSHHCADCSVIKKDLKTWDFIEDVIELKPGVHVYPFSHLLTGSLPATTKTNLGQIKYYLEVHCLLANGDELKLQEPIKVSRALYPRPDKTSIRIFPPTKLSATVTLPSVFYPVGNAQIQLHMSGVVDKDTNTRWRLRKILWRLDETVKCVSPACEAHAYKVGGEGKGILHEDTKTIGVSELKGGWKTDFDFIDPSTGIPGCAETPAIGRIETEFNVSPRPGHLMATNVASPHGMTVTHMMTLELVVAEEHMPTKPGQRSVQQTGAARVLRMQFDIAFTDRAGLGISWDEEQPPLYEDVPPSPPLYIGMENYLGPPLGDPEDLDAISPI
jgi:hypothetical protein